MSGLVGGTPLQDVFNGTGLLHGQNLGAVGDLADTAVSGATQAVDAIANVLADIGATGTLDAGENQLANDGTHVTVDTPLHSALL